METIFFILKILAYIFIAGLFLMFCLFLLYGWKADNFRRFLKPGIMCLFQDGNDKDVGIIESINSTKIKIRNEFNEVFIKSISEIYPI